MKCCGGMPTHFPPITNWLASPASGWAATRQRRYGEAETEILAGYDLLAKQTTAPERWLDFAREDLVTIYDAQHKPEQANRFRAELASVKGN